MKTILASPPTVSAIPVLAVTEWQKKTEQCTANLNNLDLGCVCFRAFREYFLRTNLLHLNPSKETQEGRTGDSSQYRVRDRTGLAVGRSVPSQRQPRPASNDSKDHEEPAVPLVNQGPHRGTARFLESPVMDNTEERLKYKSGDDDCSEYGVRIVMKLQEKGQQSTIEEYPV